MIEPRVDPLWHPVANVFIKGKGESTVAGFRLHYDWNLPESVYVSKVVPGGPINGDVIASRPWRGVSIPFVLALNRSGELTVTVGDKTRSERLQSFQLQSVELSCSTGEYKYTEVSIDVSK
jgi:hypothetical protein